MRLKIGVEQSRVCLVQAGIGMKLLVPQFTPGEEGFMLIQATSKKTMAWFERLRSESISSFIYSCLFSITNTDCSSHPSELFL